MSSSFFKFFTISTCFFFIFIFFLSLIFIPILSSPQSISLSASLPSSYRMQDNSSFLWPSPGYTTITSSFGKRKAPTSGASTFHSGIDIGIPAGTPLLAILSGIVTMTNFSGAGGCTITFKSGDYTISYCHVSPIYLVNVGDRVKQGQVIAKVGPKNVYGIANNPYRDRNGNPTNGATTGAHLHLTIRKSGELVNPLDLFTLPQN